jgi:hypothetical protein
MTRRIVSGGAVLDYVPAGLPAAGHRLQAVLRARMVDEQTGQGVEGLTVRSETPGLAPRRAEGGVAGLTAVPGRRFPELLALDAEVAMRLAAPGYLPRRVVGRYGPFAAGLGDPADFPDYAALRDLGDLALHRAPAEMAGQVVEELGATRTPLNGVDVAVAGIWSVEPGPDDDPALLEEPADLVAIRSGLAADRPFAPAAVRRRALLPAADELVLTAAVDAGTTRLRVSRRGSLAVGDLVVLGLDDPEAEEIVAVTGLPGAAGIEDAATVVVAHPLARPHRAGTRARPAELAPPPAVATPFVRDGLVGDRTLALAAVPGAWASGDLVEIFGGPADPEYHRLGLYRTQTDIFGDWRMPPLHRVARLTLSANRADFAQPLNLIVPSPTGARFTHVLRP